MSAFAFLSDCSNSIPISKYIYQLFFIPEVNQCSPSPCKNGGTCSERNNRFECTCTIGFKGVTCEGILFLMVIFLSTNYWLFYLYWLILIFFLSLARSSCSSNPCLNGGSCNEENAGYSCTCRSGYKGNNCQGL